MAPSRVIRIRKWGAYQARTDKRLAWVKLHTKTLTGELMLEPPEVFRAAVLLLLLAAEGEPRGEIVAGDEILKWRLAIGSLEELERILAALENIAFIEVSDSVGPQSDQRPTEGRPEAALARAAARSDSLVSNTLNSNSEKKKKRARTAPTEAELASAKNVLHVLNGKTGRRFRMHNPAGALTANVELIIERLRDGWLEDYLRAVVVHRWRAWGDKPEMRDNLQPSTLFRKSNFERYVADVPELEPPVELIAFDGPEGDVPDILEGGELVAFGASAGGEK